MMSKGCPCLEDAGYFPATRKLSDRRWVIKRAGVRGGEFDEMRGEFPGEQLKV